MTAVTLAPVPTARNIPTGQSNPVMKVASYELRLGPVCVKFVQHLVRRKTPTWGTRAMEVIGVKRFLLRGFRSKWQVDSYGLPKRILPRRRIRGSHGLCSVLALPVRFRTVAEFEVSEVTRPLDAASGAEGANDGGGVLMLGVDGVVETAHVGGG